MDDFNIQKSYVKKRTGAIQEIDFAKIQTRLKHLARGFSSIKDRICTNNKLVPLDNVNISTITKRVIGSVVDGIHTDELDEMAARICAELNNVHPDYDDMSLRIIISNHHKRTRTRNVMGTVEYLYRSSLVNKNYYKFVEANREQIEDIINYTKDYRIPYFGFKTLEENYLLKPANDKHAIERPQDMFMRVAIAIGMSLNNYHCEKAWKQIETTYNYMSDGYYTHASPTLFNSGTPNQQLSSCFLLGSEDSLEGIMRTATNIAEISKRAGGIGFHFNWRSAGALIKGTNGPSSGPIPFLQLYDKILKAVDQGGRRKGSGAAYMSIDHPDIEDFIQCRLRHKKVEDTTPDLFLAVCVRDLFMKRVSNDEMWSLFDPDYCHELQNIYGKEYEELYIKYEKAGKAKKTIRARELSEEMARCRLESGMPYILHIDMANRKTNQKNLGMIRSSNLCAEILEYSDADEYAVCILASLCLPRFVEDGQFNFKKLVEVARIAIINLNRIVDINDYPVVETELSNLRHRPLGLGVQGLADTYHSLKIAFNSETAKELNKLIFETIYYAAMTESCKLARQEYLRYKREKSESKTVNVITGYKVETVISEDQAVRKVIKITEKVEDLSTDAGAYSSYKGSPISKGKFQFDLWDHELDELVKTYPEFAKYNEKVQLSKMWDWESLRKKIKKFGVRNSLCIALMPTASTAQIMGNSECFEPVTTNIYRRDVSSGQFICVNKFLIKELIELGAWTSEVEKNIIINNGSVQYIDGLPDNLKERYQTVWELSQKVIIDQAADRAPFVDQTQSMNLFLSKKNKNISSITSMDRYIWLKRLKTGQYYLRTQDHNDPQKFSIKPDKTKLEEYEAAVNNIPIITDKNICIGCSG